MEPTQEKSDFSQHKDSTTNEAGKKDARNLDLTFSSVALVTVTRGRVCVRNGTLSRIADGEARKPLFDRETKHIAACRNVISNAFEIEFCDSWVFQVARNHLRSQWRGGDVVSH